MKKYYIIIQEWNKQKKEYVGRVVYETRNLERAEEYFKNARVSDDIPMIELYYDDGENDARIIHKVNLQGIGERIGV